MGFATEASTEWKMGAQTPAPQPWDKCPHPPQISDFLFGIGRDHKSLLSSATRLQDRGDLTFRSPGHTHSPVCAPTASFSFSRVVMWVICYHISNLSQLCITVYSRNIILCVIFLGHSQPLRGGGGARAPQAPPPLGPALNRQDGITKTNMKRIHV